MIKSNMAGFNLISEFKKWRKDKQDAKAKILANENARRHDITSGNFETINTNLNLDKGEKAYIVFSAEKMGLDTYTVSKKKHVLSRAVTGGLLLGPLGAIGGAATAGNKTKTVEQIARMDKGVMAFTDKRFLFVGSNSVTSIPYEKAVDVKFAPNAFDTTLTIKYTEMESYEHYIISGEDFKVSELWFEGIKNKLKK